MAQEHNANLSQFVRRDKEGNASLEVPFNNQLSDYRINDDEFGAMLPNIKNLKYIDIPNHTISDLGLTKFASYLATNKTLESLCLGHPHYPRNNEFSEIGLINLLKALKFNKTLHKFEIFITNELTEKEVGVVRDIMKTNTTLYNFNFGLGNNSTLNGLVNENHDAEKVFEKTKLKAWGGDEGKGKFLALIATENPIFDIFPTLYMQTYSI